MMGDKVIISREEYDQKDPTIGGDMPDPFLPFTDLLPTRPMTVKEKEALYASLKKDIIAEIETKYSPQGDLVPIKVQKVISGSVFVNPGSSIGASLTTLQPSSTLTPSGTKLSQPTTLTPITTLTRSTETLKSGEVQALFQGKVVVNQVPTQQAFTARIWFFDPVTKERIKLKDPTVIPYGRSRKVDVKLPEISITELALPKDPIPKPVFKLDDVSLMKPADPSILAPSDVQFTDLPKPTQPGAISIGSAPAVNKVPIPTALAIPTVKEMSLNDMTLEGFNIEGFKFSVKCPGGSTTYEVVSLSGFVDTFFDKCIDLPSTLNFIKNYFKTYSTILDDIFIKMLPKSFDKFRKKDIDNVLKLGSSRIQEMNKNVSDANSKAMEQIKGLSLGANTSIDGMNNGLKTLNDQTSNLNKNLIQISNNVETVRTGFNSKLKSEVDGFNRINASIIGQSNSQMARMNNNLYDKMVSIGTVQNSNSKKVQDTFLDLHKKVDDARAKQNAEIEKEMNRTQKDLALAINTQVGNSLTEMIRTLGIDKDNVPVLAAVTSITEEYFDVVVPQEGMTLSYTVTGIVEKKVPESLAKYLG